MTNPMGAASPLGQPGARSGYFQILNPPLYLYAVPGFPLHPAVIAAAEAGTFVFKFGTLFAQEISSGLYKVAVDDNTAVPKAWQVDVSSNTLIVGGILPSLNTAYDPSITGSSSIALPFSSWFDAQTDRVDSSYSAPAVGNYVAAGPNGDLIQATTNSPRIGVVRKVQSSISGVPGGTAVTVLTVSYKGTDLVPWIS